MKIVFWLFIVLGIVVSSVFFIIPILLLPAIAPDDFDEFIEDWKGLFRDLDESE